MTSVEEHLLRSGIVVPTLPVAAGLYLPAFRSGNLIYTSGQLPFVDGKLLEPAGKGSVNQDRVEEAAQAAKVAVLNAVAALKSVSGSLDSIDIVRMTVYVSSVPGFTSQHIVANAASSLLLEIFGQKGHHVRSAVGVAALPLDASVEIELVAEQCS